MNRDTPDAELDMLHAIVRWCDERPDPDEIEYRRIPERAFRDMAERIKKYGYAGSGSKGPLTDKQREWIRGVHARLFDAPTYENTWSAGKVPRGEALATKVPAVLQGPLPLKPPGRR